MNAAMEADWIAILRAECEGTSQARVAKRCGYTPGVISQVLKGTYRGNLSRVETAVRRVLMEGEVNCPELGGIDGETCTVWQKAALKYANTNPRRVRMFRACRACPRYLEGK
ncbi:MAG: hypothetical protein AAF415_13035 [Pseudomonadota bacterium]